MADEVKVEEEQQSKGQETTTEKKEKKKSKKEQEFEALKDELNAKSDLLARTAAEFDNYKKRTDREKSGVAEYAKANVIKKLLPIIDNIDRATVADKESAEYLKGIEMIIKQFSSIVETLELLEIAKVGDEFDPNIHEAVMHVESEVVGENIIVEVLQKGYKLGDTVIRPAMVKVAN